MYKFGVNRKVNNYNLPQPLKWGPRHNFVVVGRAEHGENSYERFPFIVLSRSERERKRKKERTVDALALGGEEGRGKLR